MKYNYYTFVLKYRCEKEYLEFRDGAARFSKLISHFCQSEDIPDTETTDRFLYIKYFTDLTIPSNGFKLNVTIGNFILLSYT